MIKIENLSFSYEGTDAPILRRINLTIEKGKILLVSGATGSGKSTLLKTFNGLAPHFTGGTISGKILIEGNDVLGFQPHDLAELVGYVNQQPEGSFATDTVEEELAFSLEQLGWSQSDMQARVQELAAIFEIETFLERPLAELSGGQQQRVAIASALAARQKLLVLDEPTSALDSRSSADILRLLKNLSEVHGITIVIAEHRQERVLPIVDSVLQIHRDGSLEKVTPDQIAKNSAWQPIATEGSLGPLVYAEENLSKAFGKQIALKPISVSLHGASVTAITGDNGTGKTTLLWEIYQTAKRQGVSVAMVPQKAADLLFLSTLADELAESDAVSTKADQTTSIRLERFVGHINPSSHPRDLSAGQQLALVLAIQLGTDAKLLLLDEPTRGLDINAKKSLARSLLELRDQGRAILVASHDADFIGAITTSQINLNQGTVLVAADEN